MDSATRMPAIARNAPHISAFPERCCSKSLQLLARNVSRFATAPPSPRLSTALDTKIALALCSPHHISQRHDTATIALANTIVLCITLFLVARGYLGWAIFVRSLFLL